MGRRNLSLVIFGRFQVACYLEHPRQNLKQQYHQPSLAQLLSSGISADGARLVIEAGEEA